jgi:hypothetical protein
MFDKVDESMRGWFGLEKEAEMWDHKAVRRDDVVGS